MKVRVAVVMLMLSAAAHAYSLDVGAVVEKFALQDQNGKVVEVAPTTDKAWTVLFFYPKADTPGCTKQACAFRDSIKVIEKENARVFGISTNSVKELKDFQDKHKLNFTLLSDDNGAICEKFGTKMPLLTVSKRHTFILDDTLKVRAIDRDVDPALDAQKVAAQLKELRK